MDITRNNNKKPYIFAISGVKNSGKTSFIVKLIPKLKEKGYKVVTIKHDGHDFEIDKKDSDTYKHIKSGADATAIYSKYKYMIISNQKNVDENKFIEYFADYDIVILEGFKYSNYPKIEIIRKGNSKEPVCNPKHVLAIATDIEDLEYSGTKLNINDIDKAIKIITQQLEKEFIQDKYDRTIDYARISVTDRCNFKCNYCAPNEIESIDTSLTHSEILSLCQSLVQIGINKIKITGGEPFLRDDIIDIIRDIKNLNGIKEVTITTNGFLLGNYLEQLKEIGIDGINISIDAMDKELFHKITKVDCFDTIFDTIKKTQALGLKNIKLNCVLIKGCNEQEYTKLAKLVQQYDICVKYIEMMPIGKGKDFEQYSLEELKKILENEFGSLTEIVNENSNGPATYYTIDGAKGKIGMIGAITHKFCKNCNRIRITSQGELKTCLQYNAKVNLRKYIFSNYITKMIRSEILNKPESHRFNENSIFDEEIKSMIEIGG